MTHWSFNRSRLVIRPFLLLCSLALSPAAFCSEVAPPTKTETEASSKPPLAVGSKAPALEPLKWLKGEPITSFDPGKVYLVECWATWCGPCLAAMPHMNELHNKFKDHGLVVIGVNVMGDTEEKAADFVTRKGDKMAYRVAYDGPDGKIAKDWLDASGVRGIPHSFLVRGGAILWHGQPSDLTEANVQLVLNGGTISITPPADQARLNEILAAYRIARNEILALLRNKEADKALGKIIEKEQILSGSQPGDPDLLRGMAYSIKGEREPSLAHYQKALKAANGDASALFRVANGLLDYGSVRDNDLALHCAREAVKADANPFFKQMQARAENAAGNKGAAIAILEKLVEEEDSGTYREDLRALKENQQAPQPAGRGGRADESQVRKRSRKRCRLLGT